VKMKIVKMFITDNFIINDPYLAEMLRLYSLIKAGIVNITYSDYENMNERDIAYLMTIAEADISAQEIKSKGIAFIQGAPNK
jgi:hypothetical protein